MKIVFVFLLTTPIIVAFSAHILQHPDARELKGKSRYGALYEGAHISTLPDNNGIYFHHGIVVNTTEDASGNKDEITIIHFSGVTVQNKSAATIQTCNLHEFTSGGKQRLFIIDYESDSSEKRHETVIRAKEYLNNKDPYDLVRWNCEHFATYCRTGNKESEQVIAFINAALNHLSGLPFDGTSSSSSIPGSTNSFSSSENMLDHFAIWIGSEND